MSRGSWTMRGARRGRATTHPDYRAVAESMRLWTERTRRELEAKYGPLKLPTEQEN